MDYSASIQDNDHQGGSPWGSPETSPQHPQRTGFGAAAGHGGDPSQSPYQRPFTASSSGLSGSDRDDFLGGDGSGGFGAGAGDAADYRRPGTASSTQSTSNADSVSEATAASGADEFAYQPQQQQYDPQSPLPPKPHDSAGQPGEAQQQQHPGQQQQQQQQQHPHRPPHPQYKLQAKITALERSAKKDPIFRFDVHTNIPRFRTTQYRDIRRLHSEFEKLAEHLISANPEALVPAVPGPVTSAGAGTDEDEARVKAQMQRWFNCVCSNEVLMRDDEMILFVESDFGYSPMVKKKQPATGVRRKILKQFAPPADDTPELQQARPTVKLFYLGTMDACHKVDKLVKARRGLGLAESDFGVKLGAMNVQEPHQGLANAYRKLGKVIQTAGDYQAVQATAEATTIGDPFEYHSSDALIFKETLTNRQLLIRELLQAQETTRGRLNAADRLKGSSNVRREKVDEAITALAEARQNEAELIQKTTRVTANLVQERRRWFARTSADLRLSIRELVIREIEAERRTLSLLESVRADIRSIDGSGGLSRLGRESHPTNVRRTSLAASQGPKGDAWSGVPRRSDAVLSRAPAGGDDAGGEGGVGGLGSPTEEYDPSSGMLRPAGIPGVITEEEDDDRVDARNAASRLASSTF
ncbi:Vacuolar protein sorting-associated protein 17 [Sporothrix eucalyptigena]|uniref:Vacuolar protein sorting-associated protein 17 n=1 Tax=Sporothrix eucalyptigena TaxID=1812306 RepID=A0ABP0B1F6_9PEZI